MLLNIQVFIIILMDFMDFKYIIFNNFTEINIREQKVVDDAHFSDGYTTRYCDIIKHINQDMWALIVDPNYIHLFTQDEIDNSVYLTADWF